ncbi:MAG: T9SS type A sorting domain-containing protein, partial [Candidatus Eisenbacteria bacterium]|nr:T9SS type A sorting domain-containing protein [Candidatus Eisenbacteria bacterium]
ASAVVPALHTLEGSINLPDGFRRAAASAAGVSEKDYPLVARSLADNEATPVRYYVVAVVDGEVVDELSATNAPRRGNHNVAFAHHGNQGLTYTTVFWGEKGENAAYAGDPANPDDGFDEILDAHDYYDLPGNFQMAGTLITGAAWHDPAFNDSLVNGVNEGWVQMLTSAYAQHIMPFVYDDMNSWSVYTHRQLTHHYYGQWPTVAWVPERVWLENPDNDGNGINAACCVIDNTLKDDFLDNDVDAVILDDYVHCGYLNDAYNDHHVYVIDNGLKVLPMDNDFNGQMGYDAGAAMNTIWNGTSDEIIIYGNDWEVAAEVAGFDVSHPSALNNYIYVLQQCSLYSSEISVWKLDDVITNFPATSITLQNGTYGLLGEWYGYGGSCNSWYCDWSSYTGDDNLDGHDPKWGYQGAWQFAHDKIVAGPDNDLSQSAWYVMMSMLHETGWHEEGSIAGWENRYSNHIKNANPYSEAALWAEGMGTYASNPIGCSIWDIDEDGRDEGVIWNDHVMAVFESIGGKANWIFAKGPGYGYSVVGNDNVYWAETSGDWNETNHTAALSDVSVGGLDREHDLYDMEIVSAVSPLVSIRMTHPDGVVSKVINLSLGDRYLDVVYDVGAETAYIKSGWTPDLVDLIWDTELYRVWDPGSGSYCGQRNSSSGATAAYVLGSGGATHNLTSTATLLEVDEIVGTGQFEFYIYAGNTSAPAGDEIAELEALSAGLTDVLPPRPVVANYYPGADRLDIAFNEIVQYDNVIKTGIALDDNDDGLADVTLTSGATILNTSDANVIQIQVTPSTASAIEALTPGTIELLLSADSFFDIADNGNEAIDNTDDVRVIYGADTRITIDGYIDTTEWAPYTLVVDDPDDDSTWHPPDEPLINELYGLYVDWDADFLYLGVNGQVQGNSWILYLDTDPGGPDGQTDLTAIDAWERGAAFTAAGFRADYQYGCYQHQSAYDSDSFFSIDSTTATTALSDSIISAFDSFHLHGTAGGSEMAIPWNVLYGLGPGTVPVNASFSLVCSICWDPEPDGQLGGDSAPSNTSASLPTVDRVCTVVIDHDGDGVPDEGSTGTESQDSALSSRSFLLQNQPNPFNPVTRVAFVVGGSAPTDVSLEVFDLAGRRVVTLYDGRLDPGAHAVSWDGRDERDNLLASGVYFARLSVGEGTDVMKMTMLK